MRLPVACSAIQIEGNRHRSVGGRGVDRFGYPQVVRPLRFFVFGLLACGGDSAVDGGSDSGSADIGVDVRDASLDVPADAAADASVDAARDAVDAEADAPAFVCDFDSPQVPPSSVRWAGLLDGSGEATLGGHGHDDGAGPIGFCPGTPVPGSPFYRLIAAGFETDVDTNSDGDMNDGLRPGFHTAEPFIGVGESGGRVNVYVDVLDESGVALNRDSAPELALLREVFGFSVDRIPLDAKPPNEFQTNAPMTGGGARFGVQVEGASDRVVNMRLPNNHHVTFVLVFQRENL